MKRIRGIHELYAENTEATDNAVWGRKVSPVSNRGFLKGNGLTAMKRPLYCLVNMVSSF